RAAFEWPAPEEFNWALEWFDAFAAGNDAPGLWIVGADGSEDKLSFDDLHRRSNQVANRLRERRVARGDRIVLMLANPLELWERLLAATKPGAVVIPATTLLAETDLRDRVERGNARFLIARSAGTAKVPSGDFTRIAVGDPVDGWLPYDYDAPETFTPDG